MIIHGIDLQSTQAAEFCKRWGIRELAVFGSILRSDFRPDSDIDVLFALEEGVKLTLESWMDMEDELTAILGRKVDLIPRRSVEAGRNPLRKQEILGTARTVYGAG